MSNRYRSLSMKMLVFMGFFLPLVETIRRSNQILIPAEFLSWFDDYMLGGVLIWAAGRLRRRCKNADLHAIAAWGIATGALFLSSIAQVRDYAKGDPGIFATQLVLVAKVLILIYMAVGLHLSIKAMEE
jgi:hypothetical protein